MAVAASSMFGVLSRTAEAGAGEMLLVEAQEEFVAPSRAFVPQPL
jgi:pyridoxine kinase